MRSKTLATNVLMILHHEGIAIGKFESEMGLSKGYLSRVSKGDIKDIALDKAYEIADRLEDTVENILTTDWVNVFEQEDKEAEILHLENEMERIQEQLRELKGVQ